MLRRIQIAASAIAAFLALWALPAVILTPYRTSAGFMTSMQQWFLMPFPWIISVAIILTVLPFFSMLSVATCRHITDRMDFVRLDRWRRFTWTLSIVETAGAIFLALNGWIFYIPSAIALLILGVGELGTILHDVEVRQRYTPHAHRILP